MAKAVTATTGMRELLVVLEPLGDLEAGDFGQLDVHQDQVGPMLAREIERLDAVARAHRCIAMRFQQIVEELHIELVVLHNQDGFRHPPFPSPVPGPMLAASGRLPATATGGGAEASPDILRKGKWNRIMKRARPTSETAEMLAIQALGFIAEEPERLAAFLAVTGLTGARHPRRGA